MMVPGEGSGHKDPRERETMIQEAAPEQRNQGRRAWGLGNHFFLFKIIYVTQLTLNSYFVERQF